MRDAAMTVHRLELWHGWVVAQLRQRLPAAVVVRQPERGLGVGREPTRWAAGLAQCASGRSHAEDAGQHSGHRCRSQTSSRMMTAGARGAPHRQSIIEHPLPGGTGQPDSGDTPSRRAGGDGHTARIRGPAGTSSDGHLRVGRDASRRTHRWPGTTLSACTPPGDHARGIATQLTGSPRGERGQGGCRGRL